MALMQMAESLGSRSVGAFVALVSVWNFLGRMGSGFASESTIFSFVDTKVYLDLWMCTCSWRSSGFVRMSALSLTFYSFWFVGSCHRYVSEYYMKQYATPRPLFLLFVQVVMAVAHLLFASSGNFWLQEGVSIHSFSHDVIWTLLLNLGQLAKYIHDWHYILDNVICKNAQSS